LPHGATGQIEDEERAVRGGALASVAPRSVITANANGDDVPGDYSPDGTQLVVLRNDPCTTAMARVGMRAWLRIAQPWWPTPPRSPRSGGWRSLRLHSDVVGPAFGAALVEQTYSIEALTECITRCAAASDAEFAYRPIRGTSSSSQRRTMRLR
jgi:hypothetical protein